MNKADILLHPVRMNIVRTLSGYQKDGLTPLEMSKRIEGVSQATLYRHLHKLHEANLIRVLKEEKVRAVTEKYYVVNFSETMMDPEEWDSYSVDQKLNYFSYYQLSLHNQYQTYLKKQEKSASKDKSTISSVDLKLDDASLEAFQQELSDLMLKYYNQSYDNTHPEATARTVGLTIIP